MRDSKRTAPRCPRCFRRVEEGLDETPGGNMVVTGWYCMAPDCDYDYMPEPGDTPERPIFHPDDFFYDDDDVAMLLTPLVAIAEREMRTNDVRASS